MHDLEQRYRRRRKHPGTFLFGAIVAVLPSSPGFAVPPPVLGQLSLPVGTPLEQNLTQFVTQLQSFMTLSQQQLTTLLGPVQQDLSIALKQAFGPLTLDLLGAEHSIQQSIAAGHVPSTTGANPVLEHRTTATRALTQHHQVLVLSKAAQAEHQNMLETAQMTLTQIQHCGEQGQTAVSTQDALKAMLCQQSGMAAMDAASIPLLQRIIETNVGVETNLSLLNEQLNGQFLAETQTHLAEAAQSRLVRSSFTSLLVSPGTRPALPAHQ